MYRSNSGMRHPVAPRRQFRGYARGGFNGSTIHESKFIKKASMPEVGEEYIPTLQFEMLPIDDKLKANVIKKGFKTPTPIQDKAIPAVLQGKDVIGIANTGTGKTAAFLIPLIEKVLQNRQEKVLIIVPTRELAQQIRDDLRSLTIGMGIYSVLTIGGDSLRRQMYELREHSNFIIGTPGRLKDLIDRRALNISAFKTFVLDEVDRMLDMGFIRDIKYLISFLPPVRQSLFFSATVSPEIDRLIQSFVQNPITISVKSGDTSKNVDQDVVRIDASVNKVQILHQLLKKEDFKKVLIFGRTKMGVERIASGLYQQGFKVTSIHGDKPQHQRAQAIRMFKENVVSILVATDVAARGIDIPDITHVINYDQPATYEDYIHRIGRTGRGDKTGVALTFV